MIGADEEGGASVPGPLEERSHERIGAHVHPVDRVPVARREPPVVHRVLRIDQSPEHVLHLVGGLEHRHEEIRIHGLKRVEDERALPVEGVVQILQENLFVDLFLVQRPRVLGPSERLVQAELPRELRAVGRRARDRDGRPAGVEVDGGEIDPDFGIGLDHVEARDPANGDERRHMELDRVPIAPGSLADGPRLALQGDLDRVSPDSQEFHRNREVGDPSLAVAPGEGIPRPVHHGAGPSRGIEGEPGNLAPHFGIGRPGGVRGVIGKGPHRAPNIGNPQPRKEYAGL